MDILQLQEPHFTRHFIGAKPDLSHLHVWGSTAYVLIQRDKHPLGSLGVHMEKCIFIGYPQGYMGWKFYNPDTKKVLISERADFDEHFFMLQKHSVPHLPSHRPESLLETPSPPFVRLPETLDDSMDDLGDLQSSQLPVHGGGGSTASDLPPVRSQTPQTPPSTYLSLPPSSPSPSKPITLPDTPPAPAAPSHPQGIRKP